MIGFFSELDRFNEEPLPAACDDAELAADDGGKGEHLLLGEPLER